MIAAIVPAHDEEDCIGDCLQALTVPVRCPRLGGEAVLPIVVLDACSDATGRIAEASGATTVRIDARNVGRARAEGARLALAAGARWLAFTDADTWVAHDWLSAQLALGHDAVCGTVAVADWGSYRERMRRHHDATCTDAGGHQRIHGANLGVSAEAYFRAGAFRPLESSEDVAFVGALRMSGASIAWSAAPRVVTSARRACRICARCRTDRMSTQALSRLVVAPLPAVEPELR